MSLERIDRANHTIVRDFNIELPRKIPPTVKGWMWSYELKWLYWAATELEAQGVPGDLLEVGSYKGLSASALGQAGHLVCVDTFQGGEDLPEHNSRHEFDEGMDLMDLHPEVRQGPSASILPELFREGRQFRLIFIDGSHEYSNVVQDLDNAWKLLSPHGALVADDYVGFPDVKRACDEFGSGPNIFLPVNPARSKMAVLNKITEGAG